MIFRVHEINPVHFPDIGRTPYVLTPTHLVHSVSLAIKNSLIKQNISSTVVCTTVVTNKMSSELLYSYSYLT